MRKILFFLLLLSGLIYSNEGKTDFVHHIGFWAGSTTGIGISYRYKPADWSIQFEFLPYYYKDTVFLSAGTSFQKYLVETEWSALLLYLGLSGIYNIYDYEYSESENNWKKERRVIGSVNLGFGPGFELKLLDRFIVSLCIGYGIFYQFQPQNEVMINFTGEGGIYYRF
ncbi:MAG: hypothetical protein N2258_02325 [Brevinematales bacterium]|nr:hypothetical protein [Brevinematales bacterium]